MSGWPDFVTWKAYLRFLLKRHHYIKHAAILGIDGSVWARSEGANEFQVGDEELKVFLNNFNDDVFANGVDLNGVHYNVKRDQENVIVGRNVNNTTLGFVMIRTLTGVMIAMYDRNLVLRAYDICKEFH
uniref:Profilin n=1 Tax=Panagrolaimus sp. ES5 TaxID=591445 RepID=A0AC34FM63_9BILA